MRLIVIAFLFKILWVIYTKLLLFGKTIGSNSIFKHCDGAVSLLQRVSSLLPDVASWCKGKVMQPHHNSGRISSLGGVSLLVSYKCGWFE